MTFQDRHSLSNREPGRFPRMTRKAADQINQRGGEPCVHCRHPEVVHASGQHGAACYLCEALPIHQRTAEPVHAFEGFEPAAHRVLLSMTLARVRSLPVGETFTYQLREYTVGAPCGDDEDGFWMCIPHGKRFTGETFPGNTERDVHLFERVWPTPHAIVWVCWQHGPERGDVALPTLDLTRSGDS